MATGTVKSFNRLKGYGFIRAETGKEVFVHLSAVQKAGLKELRKGQKVSFEIFDNQGKPAAKNLRISSTLREVTEQKLISDGTAKEVQHQMIWKKDNKPEQRRKPVTRADLERRLTEAVRTSHAEFEGFVGVIVERISATSPGRSNWAIRGVKYGRANRDRSDAVLSHCVEEAEQELEITD